MFRTFFNLSVPLFVAVSAVSVSDAASFVTFAIPGSTSTVANDINRGGTVTGSYTDASGLNHGFLRSPSGVFTTFDVPGNSTSTISAAINIYGATTGTFVDAFNAQHGYLRNQDGSFITFDVPGMGVGGSIGTVSINPSGSVVGFWQSASSPLEGFLRNPDNSVTVLNFPGSLSTVPLCLNDLGSVTGYYQDTTGSSHGFVWSAKSSFVSFDVPGASATYGKRINGSGTIGGDCLTNGTYQNFIRDSSGVTVTFSLAGNPPLELTGLNEGGEVTGFASPGEYSFGFVRSVAGAIAKFTVPEAKYTYANSLNNRGTVIGSYKIKVTESGGFLRVP
jgi:hypothetical protein